MIDEEEIQLQKRNPVSVGETEKLLEQNYELQELARQYLKKIDVSMVQELENRLGRGHRNRKTILDQLIPALPLNMWFYLNIKASTVYSWRKHHPRFNIVIREEISEKTKEHSGNCYVKLISIDTSKGDIKAGTHNP